MPGQYIPNTENNILRTKKLRRPDIPDSVERITYDAFKFCDDLKVTYRGKTYTKETFDEIYDDTPALEYFSGYYFKYKYPDHEYAIPFERINDDLHQTWWAEHCIYADQLANLPVRRYVSYDSLPEAFNKLFLPVKLYSDDIIRAEVRID